jgi:Hydrazine synthase alpha subunit middle domain
MNSFLTRLWQFCVRHVFGVFAKQYVVVGCVSLLQYVFVGCLGFLLVACGGGKGSGGGGQKPDPVVLDLPIAYVKRPIPVDEDKNPVFPELLDPIAFNPGAVILLKDRATALAEAVNITDAAFPAGSLYDVKDLSAHPLGDRLLFSMRAPMLEGVDEEDQPKWAIWEYNLKTKKLRRIIESKVVAEVGHDLSPRYLPDERILFSSTRQTRSKAILLDDSKPSFTALEESGDVPAFVLHSMKDDGTDIQQLTYNQSHDLQPTIMQDGRVLYTRWDQSGVDNLSFYTANIDGTNVERHYGYFSLNQPAATGQADLHLFRPQQLLDGRIAAIIKPEGGLLGGDMVVIDSLNFIENTQPLPAGVSTATTAQKSISTLPVNLNVGSATDPQFSKHGRFSALTPLYDGTNRLLTSWSECRLIEPSAAKKLVPCTDTWLAAAGVIEAPALYGIWIYNIDKQSQAPVVLAKEGFMFTEPVSLESRAAPAYTRPALDIKLAEESVGMLHIRSVYDIDGVFSNYGVADAATSLAAMASAAPENRPARFIRLIKAVSIPDKQTQDDLGATTYGDLFGDFNNRKEILGYAPVEPDGSVKVKVPADVAFGLEILDKDGKRLGATHNNWLQLRPGEVRECNGCHAPASPIGHGRNIAEAASINAGAATSGAQFPNTIRFDKLGTPETANMGETMAEFASRTTSCLTPGDAASCTAFTSTSSTNYREPSVDLVFDDEWTDTTVRAKSESFAYRYTDLAPNVAFENLHAPTVEGCTDVDGWSSLCRIIINYEQHIQLIWERDRVTGACISCHASADADGVAILPAGQLEFGRAKIAADEPMLSYNQLLDARDKRILNEGGALTTQIPVCEFVVDNDAIPECVVVRDANNIPTCVGVTNCQFEPDPAVGAPAGSLLLGTPDPVTGIVLPVPLVVTEQLLAPMSRGGARASARFFSKFSTGTHVGRLNNSELKLISEWLDLRANYFNNPFDTVAP